MQGWGLDFTSGESHSGKKGCSYTDIPYLAFSGYISSFIPFSEAENQESFTCFKSNYPCITAQTSRAVTQNVR